MRDVFGLRQVSEHLLWSRRGRSEKRSGCRIDNSGKRCVFLLDPFLLMRVGIHKRTCMFKSTVLVELKEALYEGAEWATNFGKGAREKEDLREVSNNSVLKARLKQLFTKMCSTK